MFAFLWSCAILAIKVAIGSLTISAGVFLTGLILFLVIQAIEAIRVRL